MGFKLHLLNASGSLGEIEKVIKSVFDRSLKRLSREFHNLKVDVVVYDYPIFAIPETGIGGNTPSANLIFIYLNSKFPDLSTSIGKDFGRMLIHEIHHAMRWKDCGYGKTLGEAIVSEGLADHFELEINGGDPQPWCIALKGEPLKKYLLEAEKEFSSKSYDHNAWFYGTKQNDIPRWTGYSLGFYLVGKYLKNNPKAKASSLHNIEAQELLLL